MKKSLLGLSLITLTLFALTSQSGCKLKNPAEGFSITAKADFVTAPSSFKIHDISKGGFNQNLEGMQVTISGRNADVVFNSGARRVFTINNGMVNVCLRRGTVATASSPIEFNIEIKVDGYLPTIYPVKLKSIDPVNETIYLTNLNELPKGADKTKGNTITDSSGATAQKTVIVLPATEQKTEKAVVEIPSGVKMTDKNGTPVTGNIAIDILHFTASTGESIKSFGKQSDNLILSPNGTKKEESTIIPAGWLNISMAADGKSVKDFSKPILALIEIPANQFNPLTGQNYREGDLVDILSQDKGTKSWVSESQAIIQKDPITENLFVEFEVAHLSTWLAGSMKNKCGSLTIPLSSAFILDMPDGNPIEASFTVQYYRNMISTDVLFEIPLTQSFVYDKAQNSLIVNYEGALPVEIVGGQLTTIVNGSSRSLSFSSSSRAVNTCEISITLGSVVTSSTFTGNFRARCTSGSTDYATLPGGSTVYYIKESDYQSNSKPANSSVLWSNFTANAATATVNWNTVSLPKTSFSTSTEYRFSVNYENKRYDYLYTMPASIPDEIIVELEIPCN
jgi:hypothetical protein